MALSRRNHFVKKSNPLGINPGIYLCIWQPILGTNVSQNGEKTTLVSTYSTFVTIQKSNRIT